MPSIGYVLVVAAGFAVTLIASRRAVRHARALAELVAVPPFVLGVTLFAIGTDLPEIANSIVASVSGHGDINVGDSVGSAATQVTLVLGLLPLVVGPFAVRRGQVARIATATVVALGVGALLFGDGRIDRFDAAVLGALWLTGSVLIWRATDADEDVAGDRRAAGAHAALALALLAVVGGGAAAAVWGLIRLAAAIGMPEYTIAFIVGSIGTSLPELVVDITALRVGARDLAIGDVFGSSFVDATLSIGVGPMIAPTVIAAPLAQEGAVVAALAVAGAGALLVTAGRHTRNSGLACLALWAIAYVAIIA